MGRRGRGGGVARQATNLFMLSLVAHKPQLRCHMLRKKLFSVFALL